MIDYSKQEVLGRFGARWACYATCLLNVLETELERRLTQREIYTCTGIFFYQEDILLSNYKDHTIPGQEEPGWTEEADPELHFYILNQEEGHNRILRELLNNFYIPNLKRKYFILKLKTMYGFHFVTQLDNGRIVNPDPSISGSIVERRGVAS